MVTLRPSDSCHYLLTWRVQPSREMEGPEDSGQEASCWNVGFGGCPETPVLLTCKSFRPWSDRQVAAALFGFPLRPPWFFLKKKINWPCKHIGNPLGIFLVGWLKRLLANQRWRPTVRETIFFRYQKASGGGGCCPRMCTVDSCASLDRSWKPGAVLWVSRSKLAVWMQP